MPDVDALRRTLSECSEEANQRGLAFVAYLIDVARVAMDSSQPVDWINGSPNEPCNRPSRSAPPSSENPGLRRRPS